MLLLIKTKLIKYSLFEVQWQKLKDSIIRYFQIIKYKVVNIQSEYL
jgi:hypothetical protein